MEQEYSSFMHEIKNNLNTIYVLSDLCARSNSLDFVSSNTKMIRQCILNISTIENDFNTYIKSGKRTINLEEKDMSEYLKKIVLASSEDVSIIFNVSKYIMKIDYGKFHQIITNLVSNAVKYGGNHIIVDGYADDSSVDKRYYHLSIQDNGIGMTESELKQIGKPFYRVKKIDKPGTGLGLSIVLNLVKIMDWKIKINSVDGVGSDITLSIPLN